MDRRTSTRMAAAADISAESASVTESASAEDVNPPRVFLSYAHEPVRPTHVRQVRALADRLRSDGIDCDLDQYHEDDPPPEGWIQWMEDHIAFDDYILMACTPTYHRRVTGREEPGQGLGATWEGKSIYAYLYQEGRRNTRFLPILLAPADRASIPIPLIDTSHVRLYAKDPEGYDLLYRRLTHQPRTPRPPLGTRRALAPLPAEALDIGQHPRHEQETVAVIGEIRAVRPVYRGSIGDPEPVLCAIVRNGSSRTAYVDRITWRVTVDGDERDYSLVNTPWDPTAGAVDQLNPPRTTGIAPGQSAEYTYLLRDLCIDLAGRGRLVALTGVTMQDQLGAEHLAEVSEETARRFARYLEVAREALA